MTRFCRIACVAVLGSGLAVVGSVAADAGVVSSPHAVPLFKLDKDNNLLQPGAEPSQMKTWAARVTTSSALHRIDVARSGWTQRRGGCAIKFTVIAAGSADGAHETNGMVGLRDELERYADSGQTARGHGRFYLEAHSSFLSSVKLSAPEGSLRYAIFAGSATSTARCATTRAAAIKAAARSFTVVAR